MSDENKDLSQEEIERLLQQAQGGGGAPSGGQSQQPEQASQQPPAAQQDQPPAAASDQDSDAVLDQDEIEKLLAQQKGGQETSQPASPPAADSAPQAAAPQEDDSSEVLSQEAIEELLAKAQAGKPAAAKAARTTAQKPAEEEPEPAVAPQDVEYLLHQAEQALRSLEEPAASSLDGLEPFELKPLQPAPPSSEAATLSLLRDVELDVRIELGRTHLPLEEVLKLGKGSVVPLNKLAGDPVEIYVNGRPVARGEVLVLNDNFCIRVAELIVGDAAKEG